MIEHVRYGRPGIDVDEPRWIVSAYLGEGFLDVRLGRHRWRLHVGPQKPPPVERIAGLSREQYLALTDEQKQARVDQQRA